jgi:DNA-binding response OmpR family regulator
MTASQPNEKLATDTFGGFPSRGRAEYRLPRAMKILIADDDVDLTDVTEYALRREGHSVTLAHDSEQALIHFQREQPDVLLLDIGIGPFDGFELARRIREHSNVPMIMVTARESEWDMARAFELGADDYVTKPYSFRQLVMRIGAVTRRARATTASTVLQAGRLRLDPDTGDVSMGETSVRLTRLEFRLLQCLLANQKRVATIERLLQFAWPSDRGDVNVLKTHISHLRRKLGNADIVIENVPGIGYRLVTPRAADLIEDEAEDAAVLTS